MGGKGSDDCGYNEDNPRRDNFNESDQLCSEVWEIYRIGEHGDKP